MSTSRNVLVALAVASLATLQPYTATSAQAQEPQGKTTQHLRFYVDGAYCMGCASVLAKAMENGGAAKVSKIAPTAGRGHVIVLAGYGHGTDLSPLAKAVNGAATPHRDRAAPGLAIEIFAELTDETAAAAKTALAKVQGIDAEGVKIDRNRGAIAVPLAGDAQVTAQGLVDALKAGGVEARIETGEKE